MNRLLPLACLFLAATSGLAPGARAQDYETTEIADGVYQFRWVRHNALFVVTDGGVVAMDPIGMDAAVALAAEIRRIAPDAPLAGIIYSHADADHSTGAGALMEGMGVTDPAAVPIIAHEKAARVIAARGSADQPVPNVTFAERLSFGVGGRSFVLYYLGPSHTDNIIVPFLPDVGVAFAVDFVANNRMGYRDLGSWHFPEFFDAVAGLLHIPFETMVFGHGPPGDRAAIQRQIAYYDDLTAAVRKAIAEGETEDEAAASVRLPAYAGWDQYDEWFELNVRGIYRWLSDGGS